MAPFVIFHNISNSTSTSNMKITALVLLMLSTMADFGQSFLFFSRSGGGGCTNCSTFFGCFFSCGRILGPSVGKRRRRRSALSTKEEYDTKENILMSLYENSRNRFDHQ